MHDQREAGQTLLDLDQHVEVQPLRAGELERAVAGADGAGQAVAPGAAHELLGLFGVGELGIGLADRDVFFDAAELAEFGLDADALGVRRVDDALGDRDVLLERLVAGVDHDGAVEPALDAVVAGLLVAVVEMDGEDGVRERSRRPRGSCLRASRLLV